MKAVVILLLFTCGIFVVTSRRVESTVKPVVSCDSKTMTVKIKADHIAKVCVDKLEHVEECCASGDKHLLQFKLSLKSKMNICKIQKLKHLASDKLIYFTMLTIHKFTKHEGVKEDKVTVFCEVLNHNFHRVRRQDETLLPDFVEAPVNISREVSMNAPEPKVTMGIRKANGQPLSQHSEEVGTNLTLFVQQAADSAKIYGIFIKKIEVGSGGNDKVKLLLDNGCPVAKSFLRSPVMKIDNANLQLPFQAFKFKFGSTVIFYVQIGICLKTCEPVKCDEFESYGRKRRSDDNAEVKDINTVAEFFIAEPDPNEVEEVDGLVVKKNLRPIK